VIGLVYFFSGADQSDPYGVQASPANTGYPSGKAGVAVHVYSALAGNTPDHFNSPCYGPGSQGRFPFAALSEADHAAIPALEVRRRNFSNFARRRLVFYPCLR
jgi:hypothetical protein